jgi:hypothetical protein
VPGACRQKLAAVLVRLSDQAHDPLLCGTWYFEAGFGLLDSRHELLASPKEAAASIKLSLLQVYEIFTD